MNKELREMLERQAAPQKARAHLQWPEKMRMALIRRKVALKLCAQSAAKETFETGPSQAGND